jgi:hypothetical protein
VEFGICETVTEWLEIKDGRALTEELGDGRSQSRFFFSDSSYTAVTSELQRTEHFAINQLLLPCRAGLNRGFSWTNGRHTSFGPTGLIEDICTYT